MASLFIKDGETAALAAEVAHLRGVTKTTAVKDALRRERDALTQARAETLVEKLDRYRAEHPLPPPTGRKSDKAFFDRMWGERD